MRKKKGTDSAHYVDNELFTAAVIKYAAACKAAEKDKKPLPQMNNYVGSCILKIAQRLSSAPNFANYSYRDEMISDGIENVFLYLKNFDAEKIIALNKKPNAFAYVTQIIYYAFLRRIEKEKKQQTIKQKAIENSGLLCEFVATQDHDNKAYTNQFIEMMQKVEFVPETDMQPKIKRRPKMNQKKKTKK